jgi:hypothetical protein
VLRAPIPPHRKDRDRILRARLTLAEPSVWPPAAGQCPLCGLNRPVPEPASRYRGAPAHTTCLARAFPLPPLLSEIGVRPGAVVPRGWTYVAHVDEITNGAAHAHALNRYRPGDIRPGSVLLVARRFGEVVEAVAFRGDPVEPGGSLRIPLAEPWDLGQGEWAGIHVRRLRGESR